MIKRKKFWKIFGISASVVVVPTVVVGGYFLIGSADTYRGFYVNPNNDGTTGFLNAYRGAVLQGAEILMAAGFNHQAPIEQAFKEQASFYKDTGFMLFDSAVSSSSLASPNTWNITYRADLGSLQTGIGAAVFLNEYKDFFKEAGGDNKLTYAMWGGQSYSSVTSFMGGFQKGVEWANANIGIADPTWEPVHQLTTYKNSSNQEIPFSDFTGGFGPSEGIGLMQQIVDLKPDILMPVAGPQVWTADTLIKVASPKTILVGVDSPVETDPRNSNYPYKDKNGNQIGNGKRIQFSSLKDLALSGQLALEIINNGNKAPQTTDPKRYDNFVDANGVGGYGTAAVGNIENKCVGVSTPGKKYFSDGETKAAKIVDYNEYDDYLTGWGQVVELDKDGKPVPVLDNGKPIIGQKTPNSMTYVGNSYAAYLKSDKPHNVYKALFNYGHPDSYGIQQNFSINMEEGVTPLVDKGIITVGKESDKKLFRIVLSSIGSILMDSSFSQSCYTGLYTYLKSMDIPIPAPVGGNS